MLATFIQRATWSVFWLYVTTFAHHFLRMLVCLGPEQNMKLLRTLNQKAKVNCIVNSLYVCTTADMLIFGEPPRVGLLCFVKACAHDIPESFQPGICFTCTMHSTRVASRKLFWKEYCFTNDWSSKPHVIEVCHVHIDHESSMFSKNDR
jgi:hypothetical protein